ncbi:hypothetical protein OIO90_000013 [Microbotryomycetes sp. JL221]|nr:hypothetical protein OIO90_000013 [Microbotryomycetes sp. JL221]
MLSKSLLTRSTLLVHSRLAAQAASTGQGRVGLVRSFATSQQSLFVRATGSRSATGSVSQQPGSKSIKELGQNAKEEVKGVAQTVSDVIAGGGGLKEAEKHVFADKKGSHGGMGTLVADLQAVKDLGQNIPKHALIWGALGLVPYAGTSLATVHLARQASIAVEASRSTGVDAEAALLVMSQVQHLQIAYGAVLLSFLGAIHWGFEFAKYGGVLGNTRYVLGIVPCVVGWGSLLLAPQYALLTQWAGFFGAWYIDQQATVRGLTPRWYSTYRFWLTALVGSSILLTLAGESYFGPDAKTMKTKSDVLAMAEGKSRKPSIPRGDKADLGEMRVEKTAESSDAFVKFSKIDKEQEEKEAQQAKEEQEKEEKRKEEEATKKEREEKARKGRAQSGMSG